MAYKTRRIKTLQPSAMMMTASIVVVVGSTWCGMTWNAQNIHTKRQKSKVFDATQSRENEIVSIQPFNAAWWEGGEWGEGEEVWLHLSKMYRFLEVGSIKIGLRNVPKRSKGLERIFFIASFNCCRCCCCFCCR